MSKLLPNLQKFFSNKRVLTVIALVLAAFILVSILKYYNLYEGEESKCVSEINILHAALSTTEDEESKKDIEKDIETKCSQCNESELCKTSYS